jgi:hypothetical protein
MTSEPLILKWYEGPQEDRTGWFLRSVHPSGEFFGEITNTSRRSQWTITGAIAETDLQLLQDIIRDLRQRAVKPDHLDVKAGWVGLLAVGKVSKPEIVLRYYEGDEEFSEAARLFLKVIGILRPYVQSAEPG